VLKLSFGRVTLLISRAKDIHRPVDHRHNVNLFWFNVVNDAVGTFYDFSNLIYIIFRNPAA